MLQTVVKLILDHHYLKRLKPWRHQWRHDYTVIFNQTSSRQSCTRKRCQRHGVQFCVSLPKSNHLHLLTILKWFNYIAHRRTRHSEIVPVPFTISGTRPIIVNTSRKVTLLTVNWWWWVPTRWPIPMAPNLWLFIQRTKGDFVHRFDFNWNKHSERVWLDEILVNSKLENWI